MRPSRGITAGSTLTVQVGTNATHTLTFGTGADEIATKAQLTTTLSAFTDITGGFNGSNDLQLTPTSTNTVTIGGTPGTVTALGLSLGTTTPTATVVTANSTRSTLQSNFNALLTQIDQLAGDSSYNGVNLLDGDNLTVNFNENGTSCADHHRRELQLDRTWTVGDHRQRVPGQQQHLYHG